MMSAIAEGNLMEAALQVLVIDHLKNSINDAVEALQSAFSTLIRSCVQLQIEISQKMDC